MCIAAERGAGCRRQGGIPSGRGILWAQPVHRRRSTKSAYVRYLVVFPVRSSLEPTCICQPLACAVQSFCCSTTNDLGQFTLTLAQIYCTCLPYCRCVAGVGPQQYPTVRRQTGSNELQLFGRFWHSQTSRFSSITIQHLFCCFIAVRSVLSKRTEIHAPEFRLTRQRPRLPVQPGGSLRFASFALHITRGVQSPAGPSLEGENCPPSAACLAIN